MLSESGYRYGGRGLRKKIYRLVDEREEGETLPLPCRREANEEEKRLYGES